MEGRCERHLFDQAADLCGRCGMEFCADCLVYSFGPKKPPFCLPCAVEAAGVRQGAGFRPAPGRKAQKELLRRREQWLRERAQRLISASPLPAADEDGSFWTETAPTPEPVEQFEPAERTTSFWSETAVSGG
jgi:hypothetical protein